MKRMLAWKVYDGESWVPVFAATRWDAARFHPTVGDVTRADMKVTRLPQLDRVGGEARELVVESKPCSHEWHRMGSEECDDPFCWDGETVDWTKTLKRNAAGEAS